MFGLFRTTRRGAAVRRLYGAIVAQARTPHFYAACGVPDTVAGRLDLLMLHLALFLRRLAGEPDEMRPLGQAVFDGFARDIENQLREFGLGDHTVPKQMRAVVESFYGRLKAYDSALEEAGNGALEAALARNLFAGEVADPARLPHLASYVRAVVAHLAAQPATAFAAGELAFPDPGGPFD
ncbi:ubiquinol-cytochrome C chaperone family protein [Blastochloris viridis]|uniref:Ubiquinol-cytochrome C chaperone n=1 Tax=Blastochloris viridis TaxID=1079 RepID=A0A0H5BD29_BLAVI|nr:ubiquinol-cytochrome C chaperone family protein [Blastochloris viridis]ALK09948.1 Ubiquinol-cytochrome C chaperone [Blastochloris viridis]BAS00143.1 ubiquinol-cytochrome C chaperone [Blastochloris viridis]CUU42611.1 hypothetical protein BVIRIDIS_16250 [Blastochloris viridis]